MANDHDKIRAEVTLRGISRLCHFTQSRKLPHILGELDGLWSTAWLKRWRPDLLDQTDPLRYDGHEDHICCSIEYPNTWYLARIRDRDPLFREWVVVFIAPVFLYQEQTLFCPRNAAAEGGSLVQAGYNGFIRLYATQITGAQGRTRARTPMMLACSPTDDQAEVLIQQHIPASAITGVAVANAEQMAAENVRQNLLPELGRVPWFVAPDLFTEQWSTMIRRGLRPTEQPA